MNKKSLLLLISGIFAFTSCNKTNNNYDNLECKSRSEHSKEHANPEPIIKYNKENGPINKGKKMSKAYKQKCKESAIRRWNKNKEK